MRVGTHALKAGARTRLWTRLAQHRGVARTGGGNHRGSVFRLLVGTALRARDGHDSASWDDGRPTAAAAIRAGEQALEQAVSREIGAMPVLWLPAEDEPGEGSERGYVERNSIALLSRYGREPVDPPSPGWLGHHCTRPRVRTSGLWVNHHVDATPEPGFLDRLARLVEGCGRRR